MDILNGQSQQKKEQLLIGSQVDRRVEGEVQPQFECPPIITDPGLVVGQLITVNRNHIICCGLKSGSEASVKQIFFRKIDDQSLDEEEKSKKIIKKREKSKIFELIIPALDIVVDGESIHPFVSWHPDKPEILMVAIGNSILKINDRIKVIRNINGEEKSLSCSINTLIDGVEFVGKHEDEVIGLSMCQWKNTTCLVSASKDGTVKIWDDGEVKPLSILRPYDDVFVSFLTGSDHIILIDLASLAGPRTKGTTIVGLKLASHNAIIIAGDGLVTMEIRDRKKYTDKTDLPERQVHGKTLRKVIRLSRHFAAAFSGDAQIAGIAMADWPTKMVSWKQGYRSRPKTRTKTVYRPFILNRMLDHLKGICFGRKELEKDRFKAIVGSIVKGTPKLCTMTAKGHEEVKGRFCAAGSGQHHALVELNKCNMDLGIEEAVEVAWRAIYRGARFDRCTGGMFSAIVIQHPNKYQMYDAWIDDVHEYFGQPKLVRSDRTSMVHTLNLPKTLQENTAITTNTQSEKLKEDMEEFIRGKQVP